MLGARGECFTVISGNPIGYDENRACLSRAGRPAEYFETLRSTGLPRQPRQYFEALDDPAVLDLLPPVERGAPERDFDLDAVLRAGTTPNGVFGAKLMWTHLPDFRQRVRDLELPGLRYVQMIRRDKVAQAVSLWTAIQTQRWRDEGEGRAPPEPVYSFAAIRHLVEQLRAQERAWTEWLDAPLVVVYEELAAAPSETIAELLRELGVEGQVPEARMRRQSDGRSQEWIDRYAQASEAGTSPAGEAVA
jgi:LPS sulfotransferase NodH